MELFPPPTTLLCIAPLYRKYPCIDGEWTFVVYCTTWSSNYKAGKTE